MYKHGLILGLFTGWRVKETVMKKAPEFEQEHFEVLPANYQPLDPGTHEEFWIPVIKCREDVGCIS